MLLTLKFPGSSVEQNLNVDEVAVSVPGGTTVEVTDTDLTVSKGDMSSTHELEDLLEVEDEEEETPEEVSAPANDMVSRHVRKFVEAAKTGGHRELRKVVSAETVRCLQICREKNYFPGPGYAKLLDSAEKYAKMLGTITLSR